MCTQYYENYMCAKLLVTAINRTCKVDLDTHSYRALYCHNGYLNAVVHTISSQCMYVVSHLCMVAEMKTHTNPSTISLDWHACKGLALC